MSHQKNGAEHLGKKSSGVILKDVTKIFQQPDTGKDFVAVNHIDLEIKDGEMVTLLGPSGCGKTTTLRMRKIVCCLSVLLLLILAAGCGASGGSSSAQGSAVSGCSSSGGTTSDTILRLDTLNVELPRTADNTAELAAALQEFPNALKSALFQSGVEVGSVHGPAEKTRGIFYSRDRIFSETKKGSKMTPP